MPGKSGNQGFSRALEAFLSYLTWERGASENTVASYRSDLVQLLEFLEDKGLAGPMQVRLSHLEEFLSLMERMGRAPSSRQRAAAAMRSFFGFLAEVEGLPVNPAELLELPKKNKRLPDFLTLGEVEALLGAPDTSTPLGLRDRAILELMYSTGLRVSETSALRLGDLDLDERLVRVMGKGKKERVVPFGPPAERALRDYITQGRPRLLAGKISEFLFVNRRGGRLSRVGIWKMMKAYATRLGIADRVHPHILRHTFATHMLLGGCDLRALQELLGHANLGTTQIYTHLDLARLREVHRSYHPRG